LSKANEDMKKKAGRPGGKTIALQERLKKIAMASRASRVKNSYSGASLLWLSCLGHPVAESRTRDLLTVLQITTSGWSKDAGSLHIALSPCAQLCNHEGWARNIRLFGFFRQRKAFDREYRDGS